MGLKDSYNDLELKYYDFIDKLDQKNPLVGKLIDSVDRIVPSFPLLVTLTLMITVGVVITVVPTDIDLGQSLQMGDISTITLTVLDESKNPLDSVSVIIQRNDKEKEFVTDGFGQVKLKSEIGGELELTLKKSGFKRKKTNIAVTSNKQDETIFLQKFLLRESVRQVKFVASNGENINTPLNAEFFCVKDGAKENVVATETPDGYTIDEACDEVQYSVSSDGYEPQTGKLSGSLVTLNPLQLNPGRLIVTIVNEDTQETITEPITVSILSSGSLIGTETGSGGIISFASVPAGKQNLSVQSLNGAYASTTVEVDILPNETTRTTIELSSKKKTINVNLTPAIQARVYVSTEEGRILESTSTNSEGKVSVAAPIKKDTVILSVATDGFFTKVENIDLSDVEVDGVKNVSISLEEITEDKQGGTEITVTECVDKEKTSEDEVLCYPSSNTSVVVTNENNFYVGQTTTDSEGKAFMQGLSGKTTFKAHNQFSEGETTIYVESQKTDNQVEILLEIGVASLGFEVVDDFGEPIVGAEVIIYDSSGQELGRGLTEEDGKIVLLDIPINKRVFALVSKEGYSKYYTSYLELVKNRKTEVEVKLDALENIPTVEIDFLGYFKGKQMASILQPGETVTARFLARTNSTEEITFFAKTGNDTITNMYYYIRGGNKIADVSNFVCGDGVDNELPNDSEKCGWIEVTLDSTGETTRVFDVEVHVAKETIPKSDLRLSYYLSIDNETSRDPETDYYTDTQYAGVSSLCDEDVCVNNSIMHNSIFLTEPYVAPTSAPLSLDMTLISTQNYDPGTISLVVESTDDSVMFQNYSVTGKNTSIQDPNFYSHETEFLAISEFDKQNPIQISSIMMVEEGVSTFRVKIYHEQTLVHEETVTINGESVIPLNVDIQPEKIYVDVPSTISLTVTDEYDLAIENSVVEISIDDGENKTTEIYYTDAQGQATISIPPQGPATVITSKVRYPGYTTSTKIYDLSKEFISINPDPLHTSVNSKTRTNVTLPLEMTNETQTDLIIKEMWVLGDSKGLLNLSEMNTVLQFQEGFEIKAGETENVNLDVVLVTAEAELLEDAVVLNDLEFGFKVSNSNEWTFKKNLQVSVTQPDACETAPALIAATESIGLFTHSGIATHSFPVVQGCSSENTPVSLDSLFARVEFPNGEVTGSVNLTVKKEGETKGTATLGTNAYTQVTSTLDPSYDDTFSIPEEYTFTINYYHVKPGIIETDFDLILKGKIGKHDTMEVRIPFHIVVGDFSNCLTINPPDILTVDEDVTLPFEVTNNCGFPVDVRWYDGEVYNASLKLVNKSSPYSRVAYNLAPTQLGGNPYMFNIKNSYYENDGVYLVSFDAKPAGSGGGWTTFARREVYYIGQNQYIPYSWDKYSVSLLGFDKTDFAILENQAFHKLIPAYGNRCLQNEMANRDAQHQRDEARVTYMVGGAVAGLAAGAVIGAVVGGWIGAIVGAVVGLIVGLVLGWLFAEEEDCRKHEEHLGDYYAILSGVGNIYDPDGDIIHNTDLISASVDNPNINVKFGGDGKPYMEYTTFRRVDPNNNFEYSTFLFDTTQDLEKDVYQNVTLRIKRRWEPASFFCTEEPLNWRDNLWDRCKKRCGKLCGTPHDPSTIIDYTTRMKFEAPLQDYISGAQPLENLTACNNGIHQGITGEDAIPPILFSWNYDEVLFEDYPDNTVRRDPMSFVADEVQTAYLILKNIEEYDKIIHQDGFDGYDGYQGLLQCPKLEIPNVNLDHAINTNLISGKAGVHSISEPRSISENVFTYDIKFYNYTTQVTNIPVEITINQNGSELRKEYRVGQNVPPNTTAGSTLIFTTNLPEGNYAITARAMKDCDDIKAQSIGTLITDCTGTGTYLQTIDNSPVVVGFTNSNLIPPDFCKDLLVTTEKIMEDTPFLFKYIDDTSLPAGWTNKEEIKDKISETLSLRIRVGNVGFNQDLFTKILELGDTRFMEMPLNQKDILNKYSQKIYFEKKFSSGGTGELELAPGDYDIYFIYEYPEGTVDSGVPLSETNLEKLRLIFYRLGSLQGQYLNTPKYSLFGELTGANGFGTDFTNHNGEITLQGGIQPLKIKDSLTSNALNQIDTYVISDTQKLNGLEMRGVLAQFEQDKIIFSPNIGTPVVAKIGDLPLSIDEQKVGYSVMEGPTPYNGVPNSFGYWIGLGHQPCKTFDSIDEPAIRYYFEPDKALDKGDARYPNQLSTKIFSFDEVTTSHSSGDNSKSNLWLSTVLYTSPNTTLSLLSLDDNLKFLKNSSDAVSGMSSVELTGTDQKYNRQGFQNEDNFTSLEQVIFDGVKDGSVCVSYQQDKIVFFRNPTPLLEATGINELDNKIGVDSSYTCANDRG